MEGLTIVFAGTPDFAARHLEALLGSHHRVTAVYTQPDRAAGRGKQLQASPVKQLAAAHSIPVLQPASLRSEEERQRLAALQADVLVVVAYGLILPQDILDTPRFGCINVHASLLPQWRGAAPIERAMLAGDTQTGVTIMQMDAGLDTGDMLHKVAVPISDQDDRLSLESKLAEAGCIALLHTLDHLSTLREQAQPQDDSQSSYARKLDKSEALINWNSSAAEIDRQIRAGIGRAPAYSFLQGTRVRLIKASAGPEQSRLPPGSIIAAGRDGLQIACRDSMLRVSHLQLPGKNVLPIGDLLNARGTLFAPGQRFADTEADSLTACTAPS